MDEAARSERERERESSAWTAHSTVPGLVKSLASQGNL